MWRGHNWTSSLPSLRNVGEEASITDVDSENFNALPSEAQESSAPCLQQNSVEQLSNESHDINMPSNSDDVCVHQVKVPCPTETSDLPVSVVSDATSLSMKTYEVGTTGHVTASGNTNPGVPETCGYYINDMVDPQTDNMEDGSGAADGGRPSRFAEPCTKGVLLLLEQAVEKGGALVLDDNKSKDADHIYQAAVNFAKSAPPEPVFMLPRKVVFRRSDKQDDLK